MNISRGARRTIVAVAMLAAAGPGCFGKGKAPVPTELRAAAVSGSAQIRDSEAGPWRALTIGAAGKTGSQLRMAEGTARLEGGPSEQLELAPSTAMTMRSPTS